MSGFSQAARGTFIGPYVLHQRIAAGPMAEVYLARGKGDDLVAVKRLQRELLLDPIFVSAAVRESRRAARIVHPHVARPRDVLLLDGRELLVVMEHVTGETLAIIAGACFRSRVRMPLPVAVGIVGGVLRGLHAAHNFQDGEQTVALVHGGVSPHNILVGIDGLARVFDFGLSVARASAPASTARYATGKSSYLAPEQILRQPIDRRTDVYAAAVVLWELATGERLFHDTGPGTIARQITSHRIPPPSEVQPELPVALDAVLTRALERSASNRFASAEELALALEAVITPASTAEIGEWLKGLAWDRLEEQANRTAAITSTPVDWRQAEDHTDWIEAGSLSPPPPGEEALLARPAREVKPAGKPDGRLVGVAAVAAALVMLFFVVRAGLREPAPDAARTPAIAPARVARPARVVEVPAPAPPQEPQAKVAAPPPAVSTPGPPRPPEAPVPAVRPPAAATIAPRPLRHTRPALKSRRAAARGCDPPYTIDADGIRRIKRECLGR